MHDETVDRTTNGSGPLSQICFSELSKLDAAAKHRLRSGDALTTAQLSRPVKNKLLLARLRKKFVTRVLSFAFRDKFAGERIPTLEEAVEDCIKLQLTIYFDVKGHPDEVHTHPNTYVRAPQTDRQTQ